MTESAYWGMLRSSLRRAFRFWKPIVLAKHAARRKSQSANKRLKFEFQCKHCEQWFPDKEVEVDHVIPCGSLKCYEDIPDFVKRLTAEDMDSYQILCHTCHTAKTNNEREERKQALYALEEPRTV